MIYSKIAVPTLLMISCIAFVAGEDGSAELDSLFEDSGEDYAEFDPFFEDSTENLAEFDSFFGDNANVGGDDNARKRKSKPKPTLRPSKKPKPRKPSRQPKPSRSKPTPRPSRQPKPSRSKPTPRPTRRPTQRPTNQKDKTTSTPTLDICNVPERVSPRRPSECSRARNNAYDEAVELFRDDFSGCDCYEVGQFSVKATNQLLQRKYKAKKKDNARKKAIKTCARDGVERYINDATKACIGPSTCQEIGFLVTDLIINKFCKNSGARIAPNNALLKQCEREARRTCEGDLFMALIDLLKDGYECPNKDMFDDAQDARDYANEVLGKQCKGMVDDMLFG